MSKAQALPNSIYFLSCGFSAWNLIPSASASDKAFEAADEKRPRFPTVIPFDTRYSLFVAMIGAPMGYKYGSRK